ncbi:MAG: hypothetical protein NPMRTH1_140006 [Nitrosopumilales archaeon]|nr:MAG: hypothetical protein NPMRTH1_140006 [Nitrosopumilales archaeon]
MKSEIILSIFAVLVLGSVPYAVNGQLSDIADHVVINEIDINPPGDDSKTISEWVEIFNPTNEEVDIGGWQIASTTILKKTLTIADGTIINPGQFRIYSYQAVWFTDLGERVELRDASGNVIDETPTITDLNNDFTTWQRLYDGFGTNSLDDWKFVTTTAGLTNGKIIIEGEVVGVSISVSSDKTNYLFDETATISGTVSKQIFQEKPFFQQQTVDIIVSGPNYYKIITLYPNMFLEYETSLKLQKVLGVSEGIYDVSVSYGDANIETQFSVGNEIFDIQQIEQAALTITTDKESYLPGETVTIFAETSEIIPFEGLKFQVTNPNGIKIYEGTLFPNSGDGTSAVRGGELNANPDAQFSTTIFMDTVSPTYGIHTIIAQYSTQAATSTFEVTEDVKENKVISLFTDKPAYGLGDTVIISGRLNNLYIAFLDLEIIQTGFALSTDPLAINQKPLDTLGTLKIVDGVRPAGDGSFGYEFKIPINSERLGDYRVTVSKDIGQETIFFKVVENPEEFVAISAPLSISTNKVVYDVGDRMVIFGNVIDPSPRSSFEVPVVSISIITEDGRPLEIIGKVDKKLLSTGGLPQGYEFTGIPDHGGNFRIETSLTVSFFPPGTYQVKAIYDNGKLSTSTLFSVVDPLDIDKSISLQLNKKVFGFGETVLLEGIIPAISQEVGITITLIKPDGDTDVSGAVADNSRFSWSWETPLYEKVSTVFNERVVSSSNYGVYQVEIKTSTISESVFFKVSPNPEEDTLEIAPLQVTTEKAIYNAGETLTVLGSAIKRSQGTEGLVVPDRVKIIISSGKFPFGQIFDSAVYLDNSGNFKSSFVLPIAVIKDGNYKVTAIYQQIRAETVFTVNNEYLIGGDAPLTLLLNIDKDEYSLGETVQISGRPSKLVYLENIVVTVIHEDELQITCGKFVCGRSGSFSARPAPSQSGLFTVDYAIPISDDAKGKYEVIVDTEFGVFSDTFIVTDKPAIVPEEQEPTSLAKRTTEKFNRIPDSFVPISVAEKISDGVEMLPRVLQGSLLTPVRGEEANVNLKISTEDGTCIIGQESDCLVTDSTRGPGTIYEVVEIDGVNYKVRYSGIDARLEKFTILPESSDGNLLDSTWNVEVIKDDQPSRLYYKITYVLPE